MTDPTLDTMTIRERLARAHYEAMQHYRWPHSPDKRERWDDLGDLDRRRWKACMDVAHQDIERQGFLIVRLEGRVNTEDKPQGAA